jgi:hypothetical protein
VKAERTPVLGGNQDFVEQLASLADLRERGALSEEEFTAAKARLFESN